MQTSPVRAVGNDRPKRTVVRKSNDCDEWIAVPPQDYPQHRSGQKP